jgi:hypothetical protein
MGELMKSNTSSRRRFAAALALNSIFDKRYLVYLKVT